MISRDCFYRYALGVDGRRIHVSEVNETNRHDGYRCVSCGCELTPVLGKKNAHHFRHKTDACSYESYIHKLWKQYVYEQWNKMSHLYVSYNVEWYCDKSANCKLVDPNEQRCNKVRNKETIDIKEKYDTCEIEGSYGGYRADLLLSNSKDPETIPTFIEICYKHPCDEQKQKSGIPIIELKVTDDNLCFTQHLTEKESNPVSFDVTLFGFDQKRQTNQSVRRFRVYQDENGIVHGKEDDNALSCHNLDGHNTDSMLEIFVVEDNARRNFSLFDFGIMTAAKHGERIIHCVRCKFWKNRGKSCLFTFYSDEDSWLVNINDFSDKELDKTNFVLLRRCFQEWPIIRSNMTNNVPYDVWINRSYRLRPIGEPSKNIFNLSKDRMTEISLKHQVNQK